MRGPAANGQLALLLEVAGTPKPGNVDRHREYDDLRFEHFLAGAVGALPGLEAAADGERVGAAFERAVEGMAEQRGGNTQFGALLVLVPLVAAAAGAGGATAETPGDGTETEGGAGTDGAAGTGSLTPEVAGRVARETTVEDAADFYRAFEHVDVAVDDPPDDLEALDVRRGSDAMPALRERGLTLYDVMERSADRDGVAAEWTSGFERCFATAESILAADGSVLDGASRAFLEQLAAEPDTFVATRQDPETAREVQRRARAVLEGAEDPETLAEQLVARDVNPGTTADVVAGGLFVALERGLDV